MNIYTPHLQLELAGLAKKRMKKLPLFFFIHHFAPDLKRTATGQL